MNCFQFISFWQLFIVIVSIRMVQFLGVVFGCYLLNFCWSGRCYKLYVVFRYKFILLICFVGCRVKKRMICLICKMKVRFYCCVLFVWITVIFCGIICLKMKVSKLYYFLCWCIILFNCGVMFLVMCLIVSVKFLWFVGLDG